FPGGQKQFFAHIDGHVWGGVGANAGVVTQKFDSDASTPLWTYRDGIDGIYTFDGNASNQNGNIVDARPEWTASDTLPGPSNSREFKFAYSLINGAERLQSVTDPLGKQIVLAWDTNGRLQSITTWNDSGTGS